MSRLFHPPAPEPDTKQRILAAAQHLFACQGYEKSTTRQLAEAAGVAEGTLFRYFENKNAIFVEVVTQGWSELLTELLTELSEMEAYDAVAEMMRHRMQNLQHHSELLRVCLMEAQFHPDLRDRIQTELLSKMLGVVEAFIQTGIERGIYRPLNPTKVAHVFLGMFIMAGFGATALNENAASPAADVELAETVADIFLHGLLIQAE